MSNTDTQFQAAGHYRESGLCCSLFSDVWDSSSPRLSVLPFLTFAFVHMIPGDPVMITMAGERGISPERHAQLLAELGLDKPMWQQYLHYVGA